MPIRWLAAAAGFFLFFRKGDAVKWFDVLVVVLGVVLLADRAVVELLRREARRIRFVGILLACVALGIVLAEFLNSGFGPSFGSEALKSHARLLFNIATFMCAALLAARGGKQLLFLSIAVLLAPLAALPAYANLQEGVFVHGGRLAGYFQTPIIFGAWMLVTFIIGLGVMPSLRDRSHRAVLFVWLVVLANFILWSASRAAWIGLLAALAAYLAHEIRRRRAGSAFQIALVALGAFALGYTFLPQAVGMRGFVSYRAANLVESTVMFSPERVSGQEHSRTVPDAARFVLDHPRGTGFTYAVYGDGGAVVRLTPASNNSFLELAIYGGFFSVLALALLIGAACRVFWGMLWHSPEGSARPPSLRLAWAIAGGAFLVDIFFTQAILWRHTWFMLGMLVGATYLALPSAKGTHPGEFPVARLPDHETRPAG